MKYVFHRDSLVICCSLRRDLYVYLLVSFKLFSSFLVAFSTSMFYFSYLFHIFRVFHSLLSRYYIVNLNSIPFPLKYPVLVKDYMTTISQLHAYVPCNNTIMVKSQCYTSGLYEIKYHDIAFHDMRSQQLNIYLLRRNIF